MADDDYDDDRGGGGRGRRDRSKGGGGGFKDVTVSGSFFARSVKTYGEKIAKILGESVAGVAFVKLGYEALTSIVGVNVLEAAAPAVTAWIQNPAVVKTWIRGLFADGDEADAVLELIDEWIDRWAESLQETLAKNGKLTEGDITKSLDAATKHIEDKLGAKLPYELALEGCPLPTQKALIALIRAMDEEQRKRFDAYRKRLTTSRGIMQIVELSLGDADDDVMDAVRLLANLEIKYGPPPKKADPAGTVASAFKKADKVIRDAVAPLVADGSPARVRIQQITAHLRRRTGQ